jgi:hypothetical protein
MPAAGQEISESTILGWAQWRRYLAAPWGRRKAELKSAIDAFLPCFIAGERLDVFPDRLLPTLAERAVPAAQRILDDAYAQTGDDAPSKAVALWQRIVQSTPVGRAERVSYLTDLGHALQFRFAAEGSVADLDAAINAATGALRAVSGDDRIRFVLHSNLAVVLQKRYEFAGGRADLDSAIDHLAEAARSKPSRDRSVRAGVLANMGNLLRIRYEETHDRTDLDASIRATVSAMSVRAQPGTVSNLGLALLARFELTNDPDDLDASIEAARAGTRNTGIDDPRRAPRFINLARALKLRYGVRGEVADLDEAVAAARVAVTAHHGSDVDGMNFRSALAMILQARFHRTGDPAVLNEAIEELRAVLDTATDEHPQRNAFLADLSALLLDRHDLNGVATDLDNAITAVRAAMRLTPDGPQRTAFLGLLFEELLRRYGNEAHRDDLEEALAIAERAADTVRHEDGRDLWLIQVSTLRWRRFQLTGEADDLDRAIAAADEASAAGGIDAIARAAYLNDLAVLLLHRYERFGAGTDLDRARTVAEAAVRAIPDDHERRPEILSNFGVVLQALAQHRDDPAIMQAAVEASTSAADATPPGAPGRKTRVANVGSVLVAQYAQTPETRDPAEVLARFATMTGLSGEELTPDWEAFEVADAIHVLELLPDEQGIHIRHALGWLHWYCADGAPPAQREPHLRAAVGLFRIVFLAGTLPIPEGLEELTAGAAAPLLVTLSDAGLQTADAGVLSIVADAWHRVADALPLGDDWSVMARYEAAVADFREFEATDARQPLDRAVATIEEAAALLRADDGRRADWLGLTGMLHGTRFEHFGSTSDLDAAVNATREAVRIVPGDDPKRDLCSDAYAVALADRARGSSRVEDLDTAIGIVRGLFESAATKDPVWLTYLRQLGEWLLLRHELAGRPADLDDAVELAQLAARKIPASHPQRAPVLAFLASGLGLRFENSGDTSDMRSAVAAARAAVEVATGDEETRSQATLATHLRVMGASTGNASNMTEAIHLYRTALDAMPLDDPNYGRLLADLGIALRVRYELTDAMTDLELAIATGRDAVGATQPHDFDRPRRLTALGGALVMRFARSGEGADLRSGIDALTEALETTPEHHLNRAKYLANLGGALRMQYETGDDPADLDSALELLEAAMTINTPTTRRERGWHLVELGRMRQTRFRRTASAEDLDAAITAFDSAVRDIPAEHPLHAESLYNKARLRYRRSQRLGDEADQEQAIADFDALAGSSLAPASLRVSACRAAASILAATQPRRAADLLEQAVLLLPRIAPRHLYRAEKEDLLGRYTGLGADAAALALAAEDRPIQARIERALRLLEAGRAVLLGQALDVRGDLSALRARDPALAARFVRLRDRLDHTEYAPDGDIDPVDLIKGPATLDAGTDQDRHSLDARFNETLAEIRALDGLGGFALPPPITELRIAAMSGPIVVLNVSRYRSDALILTVDGPDLLPLPELAHAEVLDRAEIVREALLTVERQDAPRSARRAADAQIRDVLQWLWESALGPVLDHLGFRTSHPHGRALPRVWWSPGGALGSLPMHAAGHHGDAGDDPGRRTVMDRVVSSYTPTVRALHHARQNAQAVTDATRSLVIAMATTPGHPGRLGQVPAEVAMLGNQLFQPIVLAEADPGAPPPDRSTPIPTKANVTARLRDCSIVHFACHGLSHPTDPSRSRLLLHDHNSHPLTVADIAALKLEHAQLAYLSACTTAARSARELSDEAIHLTSAFQLAGFARVVGTLWEIDDVVAADVASAFYGTLRDGQGTLRLENSASALNDAVRGIRDANPRKPSLWAAYLHAGA